MKKEDPCTVSDGISHVTTNSASASLEDSVPLVLASSSQSAPNENPAASTTCPASAILKKSGTGAVIRGRCATDLLPHWVIKLSGVTVVFLVGFLAGQHSMSAPVHPSLVAQNYTSCEDPNAVSYRYLDTENGQRAYQELSQELAAQGPVVMLSELTTRMKNDSQLESSCHPLIHRLGRDAYQQYHGDLKQAFGSLLINNPQEMAPLIRTCNAGFMHGIIEHYLLEQSATATTDEEKNKVLLHLIQDVDQQICQQLYVDPNSTTLTNQWECCHGIGHGILQQAQETSDRQGVQQALAMCRAYTDSVDTRGTCQNGIWMEYWANMRRMQGEAPSLLQICLDTQPTNQMATACFMYAPTAYLLQRPRDYTGAIQFCQQGMEFLKHNSTKYHDRIKSRQVDMYRMKCYDGVGIQSAKENLHDYTPVEAACLSITTGEKHQRKCMDKALKYYKTSFGVEKLPPTVCEPLQVYGKLCMDLT